MEWYKFLPVDTLYFRGAEPMNLGENHTASHIFPPPSHTLTGALRSAVLVQNAISFNDYRNGRVPEEITDAIGKAGESAPFQLIGPLFMENTEIFIPAPYSWLTGKKRIGEKCSVVQAQPIKSRLVKSGHSELMWAASKETELEPIGGMWIRLADFYSGSSSFAARSSESFYENEPRTGIALEPGRRVREGRLYTFNHARLKKNIFLLFGTDKPLPLDKDGSLKIGAEQRFGWYEKINDLLPDSYFSEPAEHYLSLSVMEGSEETNASVIATGRILYFGGWDMKKGFHKPMNGYFPAGTVFNKKIGHNLLAIKSLGARG